LTGLLAKGRIVEPGTRCQSHTLSAHGMRVTCLQFARILYGLAQTPMCAVCVTREKAATKRWLQSHDHHEKGGAQ
jgi:hypothetical protein